MLNYLLCPAALLHGVKVGAELSKLEGTFTSYHSFLMKGWALQTTKPVRYAISKIGSRVVTSFPLKPQQELKQKRAEATQAHINTYTFFLAPFFLKFLGFLPAVIISSFVQILTERVTF